MNRRFCLGISDYFLPDGIEMTDTELTKDPVEMSGVVLDYAGFVAIEDKLTTELAAVIQIQLDNMGDDIKGLSWFSSVADSYFLTEGIEMTDTTEVPETTSDDVVIFDLRELAELLHEVNRAICASFDHWKADDPAMADWEDVPQSMVDSILDGIKWIIEHPTSNSGEDSHENWASYKRAQGWVYGPVKDMEKKTHPCLAPYDELPPEQKVKDEVFMAIVKYAIKYGMRRVDFLEFCRDS